MKLTKKRNFLLILSLVILFPISISYGSAPIEDLSPANLRSQSQEAIYDCRDTGVVSNSGAYFSASVGVVLGELLLDYNDVLEVKVKHLETEQEYSLSPDQCTNYLGVDMQAWGVFLRPSSWMFEGHWRFTMLYKGSDGYKHKQFVDAVPGPEVFPPVPDIEIVKTEYVITISWSAMPIEPGYENQYRVRVYDPDGICPLFWGLSISNGVISAQFPSGFIGRKVRLENRMVITPYPPYLYSRGTKEFILE